MLIWFLILPALAIAAIVAKAPPKGAALLATGANLLLAVYCACHFTPGGGGFQFETRSAWAGSLGGVNAVGLPPIAYHVGLDGISLPLVLLSALVSFCAVAVTPRTIERGAEFFACVLLISLGVTGAFFSLDLFFLYIFHEFALIPAFLLIGIWGLGNRQFASFQLTLYLTLGSLILLAGGIALGAAFQTFDLSDIARRMVRFTPPFGLPSVPWRPPSGPFPGEAIFGLFLVGCGILVSLVPFHTWAPPGYASAPPAAAMLHAGVLKKFGLYVLLRVAWPLFPDVAQHWMPLLLTLVLLHVFYIGFVALAQKELGTMLAYSSIMHMGYLFLGLAAWNRLGVSGMVFLMVAHGLSTALLFALHGEIARRTGEVRLAHLGGLAKATPFLASVFVLGAMAALGLPALPNFTGELLIFFGAWKAHPVITACVLWGAVITAVFLLRAVRDIFFGPLPERFADVPDIRGWDRAPYLLLAAAIVAVGVAPGILLQWIQPAVDALLAGGVR